jgi:hypothetical protein
LGSGGSARDDLVLGPEETFLVRVHGPRALLRLREEISDRGQELRAIPSSESQAPAWTSESSTRRLMAARSTRRMKIASVRNRPPSRRARTIASTDPCPTFFTAARP